MTKAETETVIIINEADREEGFFTFGTSNEAHVRKVRKRIKPDFILDCKESKNSKGEITWRAFKLDYRALALTLGLKKTFGPNKSKAHLYFGPKKGIPNE